jgi:DNA-binding response OmpR family regulator
MGQQVQQDRLLHVLIVDDEPDIREEIKAALDINGFITEAAASYSEAHAYLVAIWEQGRQVIDVVILDVRLADGNGLQLFQDILQIWPGKQRRPAVICLSGDCSAAAINQALAAGAAGYVTKPASIHEITRSIHTVLSI